MQGRSAVLVTGRADRYPHPDCRNRRKKRMKKRMIGYLLLRPKSTPAAPSPAKTPITGAGEAPVCAAGFCSTGFTCGTSGVCVTAGAGVGVEVGVGSAVSQIEEPCEGLLFFTGISNSAVTVTFAAGIVKVLPEMGVALLPSGVYVREPALSWYPASGVAVRVTVAPV